jgi:hypothetical protein
MGRVASTLQQRFMSSRAHHNKPNLSASLGKTSQTDPQFGS